MDPHSFFARAEAQRWVAIAEKLLMGRDVVGSKTFAIRARESDPRLEAADQILAVADTLLAAEKRAGSSSQQPDWYAILQLVRLTQDSELIAGQYGRLAFLLNPHSNRFPFADQAFQLVSDAWSVLSNPVRKSLYDGEINFHHQMNPIGFFPEQNQQEQQHNFFSQSNPIVSSHQHEKPEQVFHIRPQHNFLSQLNPIGLGRESELSARPFQIQPQQQQPPQLQPLVPPGPHPFTQPPLPPSLQPQQMLDQLQPPPPREVLFHQALLQQHHIRQQQPPQPLPHQLQTSEERNAAIPSNKTSDGSVREEDERETEDSGPFWTACPFCYYMYEYPSVYAECMIRCPSCDRAFQAVVLPSPPDVSDGKEKRFCCWGFFPMGVSVSSVEKSEGKGSTWTPFSAMHEMDIMPKKRRGIRGWVIIDDDNAFEEISESSDDSDVDWRRRGRIQRRKKKSKRMKRKGLGRKRVHQVEVVNSNVDAVGSGESLQAGLAVEEGVGASKIPVVETSKKVVGGVPRRHSGRVAKELGKLDLNVEFNNNEGEEQPTRVAAVGNRGGHGEEDNIEGSAFFEGLDEFLSSLPILSAVADDKVKGA